MASAASVSSTRGGSLVRICVGFMAQAGYFVSEQLPVEFAADFSMIRAIGNDSDIDENNELGLGVNYYIFGDHAVNCGRVRAPVDEGRQRQRRQSRARAAAGVAVARQYGASIRARDLS